MVVFGSFIPKPPNQQITYLTPTLAGSTSMSFQPSHSSLPKCLSASLGVRWMIGQTEIKQSSNYGCKEVPLNNNWRLFFFWSNQRSSFANRKACSPQLNATCYRKDWSYECKPVWRRQVEGIAREQTWGCCAAGCFLLERAATWLKWCLISAKTCTQWCHDAIISNWL